MCVKFHDDIMKAPTAIERERIRKLRYEHIQFIRKCRAYYREHRLKAMASPGQIWSLIVDAMDQVVGVYHP